MNVDLLNQSCQELTKRFKDPKPIITFVLGSGWGGITESFETIDSVEYENIPALGNTGVQGHTGKVFLAKHRDKQILIFQGRHHWYEGFGWEPVCFPIIFSHDIGVPTVILTNAAGSLREDLKPGSLMIIDDHINSMGSNPLIGEHNPAYGPRFPDQSNVYNKELSSMVDQIAENINLPMHHGIYAATSGPSYETPAETQSLRIMGASAVGMSTVPEAIMANSMGLSILGISCITNFAAGMTNKPLSHSEVIQETNNAMPNMQRILSAIVSEISKDDNK